MVLAVLERQRRIIIQNPHKSRKKDLPFCGVAGGHPSGYSSRTGPFDIPHCFWYRILPMKQGIDYIGVGVGAVIRNETGRYFLAKRGPAARNEPGKWEFPGGSVEFNERLEDALIREIAEEFGFVISVEKLLDVVDHILPDEKQHWVSPTFLCRFLSGDPKIREPLKCDAIGWFRLADFPRSELTRASDSSLRSLERYLAAERVRP